MTIDEYKNRSKSLIGEIGPFLYIPNDSYEYQIRIPDETCDPRERYLSWSCHGFFIFTGQNWGMYIPESVVSNNPDFVRLYIDSHRLELQKITLDDLFIEQPFGYGNRGFFHRINHYLNFDFDDKLKKGISIM